MSITHPYPSRHIAEQPAPDRVRREVAILMADGRWRTARDVAVRVNARVSQTNEALRRLKLMGILEGESINDGRTMTMIYRKKP